MKSLEETIIRMAELIQQNFILKQELEKIKNRIETVLEEVKSGETLRNNPEK
jgi:hypothetical protein